VILAGTGTVTRHPDFPQPERIVRHAAALPADGLELVACGAWFDGDPALVAAQLRAAGLSFPVVHAEKSIGAGLSADDPRAWVTRFAANCSFARGVGGRTVVLHLWELPDGDRLLERNLAAVPRLLDVTDGEGLTLAVETIPCSVGSPLANLRRVVEADARVRVTLDTEFLALHGELLEAVAADWLWDDGGRVAHVHVKDFAGTLRGPDGRRRYLIPGEGSLDLAAFFAGLRARGYDGTVTLEAPGVRDDGEPDLPRITEGLRRLRRLVAG
jgi:sugar phosphate isomerase/epimerase